jgi:hypothetical protein
MQAKPFGHWVLIAAVLVAGNTARAQSAAVVEHVMVGVSTQSKRLDTALTHLGEITKGLHGTDLDSADQVANAGRQFSGAVGEATPVGLLLRHMKHHDDIQFTRAIFAISASKALLIADVDTDIINRCLPQIANPAAAAESAEIRDAILLTRNLLEAYAVTAAQNGSAPHASAAPDSRTAALARKPS